MRKHIKEELIRTIYYAPGINAYIAITNITKHNASILHSFALRKAYIQHKKIQQKKNLNLGYKTILHSIYTLTYSVNLTL